MFTGAHKRVYRPKLHSCRSVTVKANCKMASIQICFVSFLLLLPLPDARLACPAARLMPPDLALPPTWPAPPPAWPVAPLAWLAPPPAPGHVSAPGRPASGRGSTWPRVPVAAVAPGLAAGLPCEALSGCCLSHHFSTKLDLENT
jgi:hypothetical protein